MVALELSEQNDWESHKRLSILYDAVVISQRKHRSATKLLNYNVMFNFIKDFFISRLYQRAVKV